MTIFVCEMMRSTEAAKVNVKMSNKATSLTMETCEIDNIQQRRISTNQAVLRTPQIKTQRRESVSSRQVLNNVNTNVMATPFFKNTATQSSIKTVPSTPSVQTSVNKIKQQQQQQQHRQQITRLEEKVSSLEMENDELRATLSKRDLEHIDQNAELNAQLLKLREELKNVMDRESEASENAKCREQIQSKKIHELTQYNEALVMTLERFGYNPITLKSFDFVQGEHERVSNQKIEFDLTLAKTSKAMEENREMLQLEAHRLHRCLKDFELLSTEFNVIDDDKHSNIDFGIDRSEMQRIKKLCEQIKSENDFKRSVIVDEDHEME